MRSSDCSTLEVLARLKTLALNRIVPHFRVQFKSPKQSESKGTEDEVGINKAKEIEWKWVEWKAKAMAAKCVVSRLARYSWVVDLLRISHFVCA